MSSFIFVGDLNVHHQEWLYSVNPTNCPGIAPFNFANLSSCTQLIKEPTRKFGNCLDLLLSDVPSVVYYLVDPSLGNSDHSSISFSVKMSFNFLIYHFLVCFENIVFIVLVLVVISLITTIVWSITVIIQYLSSIR